MTGRFRFAVSLLLIGRIFALDAQTDTARTLPEVLVDDRYTAGGYHWTADSLPVSGVSTVAERLQWEGPVQIRSNGPGLLSTASFRGAGPSRTPVIWEDINLQSTMNGVFDLALLPYWPGDELSVQYGGQSAGLSSGAMGGSVQLSAPTPNANGLGGLAAAGGGSFGLADARLGLNYGGVKWHGATRTDIARSENNFPFKNTTLIGAPRVKQQHARQNQYNFQQFGNWQLSAKNSLKLSLWAQRAYREIPPSMTEAPNGNWQGDEGLRTVLNWLHQSSENRQWRNRFGWTDEKIRFHTDAGTDESHARSLLWSSTYARQLSGNLLWKAGATAQWQRARSDGYGDSGAWYRQWCLAGFAYLEKSGRNWQGQLALRQEWAEKQAAPFTGSAKWRWQFRPKWRVQSLVSRNFTLPTFNDRYWKQLGNPGLKPEKGYSADCFVQFTPGLLQLTAGLQSLLMDNWILWQPGADGLFRPGNLRKVWSRGLYTELAYRGRVGGLQWSANAQYQWNRVENVAIYAGTPGYLNSQLPYTPLQMASGRLTLKGRQWQCSYLHQWSGKRFVDSGSAGALPAYGVGALMVSWRVWKRLSLEARLENCWNSAYQLIAYRPMPGRYGYLGISCAF